MTLTNLNLSAPLTGTRYSDLNQNSLNIIGNNVTVNNVTITGSAAGGVFVYGASGFNLSNVTVQNTRADGVHITNGSSFGQLTNVTTKMTVMTASRSCPTRLIRRRRTTSSSIPARSPEPPGGAAVGGRWLQRHRQQHQGVVIVGGRHLHRRRGRALVHPLGQQRHHQWRHRYRCEHQHHGDHGAVLIYSGNTGASISGVTINGLTVASTTSTAGRNLGIIVDAGSVRGISLTNIALKNTTLDPFVTSSNVPAGSYTATGWTLNGLPIKVV